MRSKKKWVEQYREIHQEFEDLQVLIEFAKEDPDSEHVTSYMGGAFKTDSALRMEFLTLIGK